MKESLVNYLIGWFVAGIGLAIGWRLGSLGVDLVCKLVKKPAVQTKVLNEQA